MLTEVESLVRQQLKTNDYQSLEKTLRQIDSLKNTVKIESVSAMVETCYSIVEKQARE